ncbi:hypothetical protein M422DRAFT_265537 [Sphaerobolus stellatus SS14]|uniref:Uncharacterized protein n=1 Tax=Sphaerobolus stellatus (strain SS14) TaxID=990650 RepID=A0A0C9V5G7_SPHS4|nr:hypothetical protein M422DRAFT_265537 [Sphaerobolus stellatus SS14]
MKWHCRISTELRLCEEPPGRGEEEFGGPEGRTGRIRSSLRSLTAVPTPEGFAAGQEISRSEADDKDGFAPLPPLDPTSFWLTVLRYHIGLADIITDRDAECLKHLKHNRVSYLPEKEGDAEMGFKLQYFFATNDFFTNEVLTKSYIYRDELGYEGDFTRTARLIRKAHSNDSFFNFFTPPIPPSEEDIENGDVEDEEMEDIEERLELDYQIGGDIKKRVSI